jgi:hypothetical protein
MANRTTAATKKATKATKATTKTKTKRKTKKAAPKRASASKTKAATKRKPVKKARSGKGKAAKARAVKPEIPAVSVEIPSVPEGRENRRNEPLFLQHPLDTTYVSKHGVRMPSSFHGYDLDGTGIVCLADLTEVRKYLAGANYAPVRFNDRFAVVSLLLNKYYDSSVGPYDAIVMNIFATRQELVLPWTDPTSALLPALLPQVDVVIGPYAMSPNTRAADIGRDLMGINKLETDATIENDSATRATTATIIDGYGKKILDVHVDDATESAATMYGAALLQNLAALMGKRAPAKPPPGPAIKTFVGYDPDSKLALAKTTAFIESRLILKSWGPNDRLEAQKGIHVTDLLIRFRAKPVLTTRDRRMAVVLKPEKSDISAGVEDNQLSPSLDGVQA